MKSMYKLLKNEEYVLEDGNEYVLIGGDAHIAKSANIVVPQPSSTHRELVLLFWAHCIVMATKIF